jgi:hypothetical protein
MKLLQNIRARGFTLDGYAKHMGWHVETVRRYCLPADHPKFQVPRRRQMREIFLDTGGVVTPNDFYDLPELPVAGALIVESGPRAPGAAA